MSQICPSSSHQLVAAAIAFRRARRKFPKNYGLRDGPEDSSQSLQSERVTGNEDHDEQEVPFSLKCANTSRSSNVCSTSSWNEEQGENTSSKQYLFRKPIICSCCRKRSETSKDSKLINITKFEDERNAGDALDIIPSREHNKFTAPFARRNDLEIGDQQENCDTKAVENSEVESLDTTRQCATNSHSQKTGPTENFSKSVNLIYDGYKEKMNNIQNYSNLNDRPQSRDRARRPETPQRDNTSRGGRCSCDEFHSPKYSNLDLPRPRPCQRGSSHSQCFHNYYHHHDSCKQYNSSSRISSKHSCCLKEFDKGSAAQKQNDEDNDDHVGTIDHKDSLCILVEKYNAGKKCGHEKFTDEPELSDDRFVVECNRSSILENNSQSDRNSTSTITNQTQMYLTNDSCHPGENNSSTGKKCRHDCGQIFKESDCNQSKDGTWRHTF